MYLPEPLPGSEKKLTAGLLAILVGSLGIHKFYLGYTNTGLAMLLCSILSCGILVPVMHVISIIEGIIYLSAPDSIFVNTYVRGRKEWF